MEQQQEQQEHPGKQKQPQRPEQDEEWYDFSKKEKHDPWKSYKDNKSQGWTGGSDRQSNTWQQQYKKGHHQPKGKGWEGTGWPQQQDMQQK